MAAGDASLSRPKLQGWSLPVKSIFVVLLWTSVNLAATSEKSGCGELKGEEVCCGGRKYHRDFDRVCCSLRGYPEGEFTYMVEIRCKNGSSNDPLETCGPRQFDNRYEDCCDKVCFDRQTYKCCTGSTGSTVVGLETACCDGQGLKPGEMCCQTDVDVVIINKTNPAHTNCCVSQDFTDIQKEKHRIETYDRSSHYCLKGILYLKRGKFTPVPVGSSSAESPLVAMLMFLLAVLHIC